MANDELQGVFKSREGSKSGCCKNVMGDIDSCNHFCWTDVPGFDARHVNDRLQQTLKFGIL